MARRSRAWAFVVAALVLTACGDAAQPAAPHPLVADIPAALDAFAGRGAGTELFQVSGTPERVELIQRVETEAVGLTFAGGVLSVGEPLGPADGFTFTADDVDFDTVHVLDGITDELDDPTITRFEVVGGPDGPLYSAEVLSDAGGTLLVDLAPDGEVLGVVPEG